MAKGVITEKEWESGSASASGSAKAAGILKYLGSVDGAASMKAIKAGTKITWPYSTVQDLVKLGTLEFRKIGKAKYYRMKKARKSA